MNEIILTGTSNAVIKTFNGDEYRINVTDNGICVTNVSMDDKSVLVKPMVSNQVFIISIELPFKTS